MTYKPRTLAELEQDALASARERIPEASWSKGTDNRARLSLNATMAWHLQADVGRVERDLLPDTASEAGLLRWGKILELPRNGATVAGRDRALRVRGVPGSSVSNGTTLVYEPTGALYQVTEDTVIPSAGSVDVDIVSITTGSMARLDAGEVLTFEAAPGGIMTEAQLQLDLLGGLDIEPLESYRMRVIRRFKESGALVTSIDWQAAAERLSTVDAAYVYPMRAGLGTLDIAVLRAGRGAVRVLTDAELLEVRAYLDARRMTSMRGFRVLSVAIQPVDIEIAITERPGQADAWDWGGGEPVVITSYDPNTRTAALAERPFDLRRGSRVVLADALGNADGSVSTVIDTVSDDAIVLDRDHGYTYGGDDRLWPAGDLTEPCRAAVLGYYLDSLGPAAGEHGGTWPDSIKRSLLEAAIFAEVPGVRDVSIISPTTDVEPEDPPPGLSDDFVSLLVPRQVLVRRAAP
ncbi:MAG: baseplate J/gp47 family protein [Myxococcota bacterium]